MYIYYINNKATTEGKAVEALDNDGLNGDSFLLDMKEVLANTTLTVTTHLKKDCDVVAVCWE